MTFLNTVASVEAAVVFGQIIYWKRPFTVHDGGLFL
jgi:hypothetical protein